MDWTHSIATELATGERDMHEPRKVPLQDFDAYYDEMQDFVDNN